MKNILSFKTALLLILIAVALLLLKLPALSLTVVFLSICIIISLVVSIALKETLSIFREKILNTESREVKKRDSVIT